MVVGRAVAGVGEGVEVLGPDTEHVDAVLVDELPQPARTGVHHVSVDGDDRDPRGEGRDQPVPHHPPAGRDVEQAVAGRQVGVELVLLGVGRAAPGRWRGRCTSACPWCRSSTGRTRGGGSSAGSSGAGDRGAERGTPSQSVARASPSGARSGVRRRSRPGRPGGRGGCRRSRTRRRRRTRSVRSGRTGRAPRPAPKSGLVDENTAPDRGRAQHGDDGLDAVGQPDRHPVALADPLVGERGGHRPDLGGEIVPA